MFWNIIIAALGVIVLVFVILALINRYLSQKAIKAIDVPGDLIEVRPNEYIHAFSMGEGKYTMIMTSGLGTPSPYADFHDLAEKISKFCRVIILELPGYGFSTVTWSPRTLENYEKEINTCLAHYGIKENVILMPHSYSGIFTFDYAKKHRDVVCALFNDDVSAYYQFNNKNYGFKRRIAAYKEAFQMTNFGKLFYEHIADEAVAGFKEPYKSIYKAIMLTKDVNHTVRAEINAMPRMGARIRGQRYDADLPVLNMVARRSEKSDQEFIKKIGMTWIDTHIALQTNPRIQKTVVIEGAGHYIHSTHADEMAELAKEFIKQLQED